MPSDDHLDDVADAILDGASIDWSQVEVRAGSDRPLLDGLKVLAALADVHRDSTPADRWGHFALIEPLGRGAFGRVFRARDTRLDREVALKLLEAPSPSADTRASSIVDEGRLLAQVRHPNVVTIYGAAKIGNEVGLWMELVQGRTLQQLLDEGKRFTAVEAVEIGTQLCEAVAAVHTAGLLHRDIKAANVMLSDQGRVVLMDFGTGWEVRDDSRAVPAGTPLYLAPELLEGGKPTVQTDIYAVGVLLFHLLTGRYPVTARTVDELKRAHAGRLRVDLRALRADVPGALAAVIEAAMAPVSEHRYKTATAMTAELRQAIRRVPRSFVVAATTVAVVGALLAAQAFRPTERPSTASAANETFAAAIRPVTSTPGEKWHPSLSPDETQVAYAWKRAGVWEIHVTDLESGRTRQVKNTEDGSYPRWAPDGRSLAFLRRFVSDEGPQAAVRVVALDGSEPKTLWQTGSLLVGSGLTWSPDGRQLALSVRSSISQPLRIMLLDVGTLARRWLTDPDSAGGDTLPAFSPDGGSIAFVRSTGPESALHVAQLETGEVRRLAAGQHDVGHMTWSDEGRSLIFTSFHPGGKDTLWRIPSAGGEPQRIAGVGEGAKYPFAGDAGRLVYLQQVIDSNIYRVSLPAGAALAPQLLAPSTRADSSPDISPDSLRIAFASNRSGSNEVWLADGDGANARQLTDLGTAVQPRWSPDGRRLVCSVASTASAASIHVIDASSGASRRLTDGAALEKWPTWAADGQSIYYASNRSGTWQIWKVSLAGGAPVQITHRGGLKAWESIDGSLIYYSRESAAESAIWRMPVRGGDPALVLRLPRGTSWGGEWIVKPEGIYWLNAHRGARIELFSFATGRSVPVIVPRGPYDHGSGFSVSNDGRWAVFSGMDYHGTDIMMIAPTRSP